MPRREEERGRGLCPFCGSSNVYYNKHYRSWKCTKCEKSFPSPSYGPGGDFGKEARWFRKTTEETRRKEFAEAARRKRISKWRKLPRGGFTARKAFLIFLLIACVAAAVWAGYLLFTNRTAPVIGTIIFVVDIGVLIWNISVLRKWRVRTGTVVAIAVIIAVLAATTAAFAGVEPFSSAKANVVAWFQKAGTETVAEPKPVAEAENWKIQLDGKSWKGSTVTVKLTITNLGSRRNFGYASLMDVGPELVVIDSTGKLVEPWVPEPNIKKGELFIFPPYTREFYPDESWSGSLKFEMSPYSGETKLYMTRFYHVRQYFLFDLGSPAKD